MTTVTGGASSSGSRVGRLAFRLRVLRRDRACRRLAVDPAGPAVRAESRQDLLAIGKRRGRVYHRGRMDPEPIRVLRVIARLNVGGPALHVSYLTRELDRIGYETTLVAGRGRRERGLDGVRRRGARGRAASTCRRSSGRSRRSHDLAAVARSCCG